jgi:hypothetical protein
VTFVEGAARIGQAEGVPPVAKLSAGVREHILLDQRAAFVIAQEFSSLAIAPVGLGIA